MEDAKITHEPLYQQGRFPSIIDTDDLVFELGRQSVNHLNHEKLLDKMIKQIEILQREKLQSNKIQVDQKTVGLKTKQLEDSNKLYEENNRKLGNEIVNLRNQIEELNNKIDDITKSYQKELSDTTDKFQLEIEELKKKSKRKVVTNVKHNTSS